MISYEHCHCHDTSKDSDEKQKLLQAYGKERAAIEKFRSELKLQLQQLVNGSYLDIDYYDARKYKVKEWYTKAIESKNNNPLQNDVEQPQEDSEQQDNVERMQGNEQAQSTTEKLYRKSIKWYIFMMCKYSLILLRFVFRLLIVPLLQLQWLNDYAWNCVMDGFLRDYCESITNEYFSSLDHSLVLYSVYVFVLVALLFSVMIAWLPRGTPQISIDYDPKVKRGIIPQSVHMNRKRKLF